MEGKCDGKAEEGGSEHMANKRRHMDSLNTILVKHGNEIGYKAKSITQGRILQGRRRESSVASQKDLLFGMSDIGILWVVALIGHGWSLVLALAESGVGARCTVPTFFRSWQNSS